MYTLSGDIYKQMAVFRKETFWVLPPGATTHISGTRFEYDEKPHARVFHTCPKLKTGQHTDSDVGIVFLTDDTKEMKCDRCHKTPHDDVLTVWELMR
jgi:hypothetical protein